MDLRTWLARLNLQAPAAILFEAYRPLSWFAGELLAATAPLLPLDQDQMVHLGQRLRREEDPNQAGELLGEKR